VFIIIFVKFDCCFEFPNANFCEFQLGWQRLWKREEERKTEERKIRNSSSQCSDEDGREED